MKTITKKINICAFSELSEQAKQRAKDRHAEQFGYPFAEEAIASIKALAEHFGGKMRNYSLDFFATSHSSMDFDMPDMEESEISEKLAKLGKFNPETLKGTGECLLTGYCSDENAIDGFRIAWHEGERDLDRLMQAAFDSWLEDAQSDCAAYYTDEAFAETSDANEWEYTEDGKFFCK